MTPTLPPPALLPRTLSMAQFQTLAEVPPEIEWFANLTNANTLRVRVNENRFLTIEERVWQRSPPVSSSMP